jgi:hypothetical protein
MGNNFFGLRCEWRELFCQQHSVQTVTRQNVADKTLLNNVNSFLKGSSQVRFLIVKRVNKTNIE